MNISQYRPNADMAHDAITSLSHLPSIGESLAILNSREQETQPDEAEPRFWASPDGALELEYRSEDGRATIVGATSSSVCATIPSTLGGQPVISIGSHAFSTCYGLEDISFPDGIRSIGEYSFMNTAIRTFDAPSSLETIGNNAFYKCIALREASLNDGLKAIGDNAFRESAIESLTVPATVSSIGQNAFKGTQLVVNGPNRSLHIAEDNRNYRISGGVLYAVDGGSVVLIQALDDTLAEYSADLPITAVANRAFVGLANLRRVSFPDGLIALGNEAFKGCSELRNVDLPNSTERIGSRAFMSTKLESFRIPCSLREIGTAALYTGSSIARNFERTIKQIEIAPGNDAFYLRDDMLCHRKAQGDAVILYIGDGPTVYIPDEISFIGPYAFLNASNVRTLRIHDGIESIDVGGFDFGAGIPKVVYEIVHNPLHAGERYIISYPHGQSGRQAARQAFSRGYFDLAYAYAGVDNAIITTRDVFARSRAMLERLRDPVMLNEKTRAAFEKSLSRALPPIIVEFGRNGFTEGIDWLREAGFLAPSTIDAAIEAASKAGEIAVLSRLVEIRHSEFSAPLFDFEL